MNVKEFNSKLEKLSFHTDPRSALEITKLFLISAALTWFLVINFSFIITNETYSLVSMSLVLVLFINRISNLIGKMVNHVNGILFSANFLFTILVSCTISASGTILSFLNFALLLAFFLRVIFQINMIDAIKKL